MAFCYCSVALVRGVQDVFAAFRVRGNKHPQMASSPECVPAPSAVVEAKAVRERATPAAAIQR